MRKLWTAFVAGLCLGGGCSGPALVVDRSIPAVEAGDYTLATSACENVPGGGMDICRVAEGSLIDSSWKLVIPTHGGEITGWEVDAFYRDVQTAVHVVGVGSLISIPWKDFFKADKWSKDQDGEVLALVSVKYLQDTGVEEIVLMKGLAKILVLSPGYSRLPIDSGSQAWGTTCKVQYSTAGRGAVSCK